MIRLGIEQQAWREHAACNGHPTSWWFPAARVDSRGRAIAGAASGRNTTRAKQICMTCPVAAECLEHSLVWPEMSGIWGGIDQHRRRRLRTQRRDLQGRL